MGIFDALNTSVSGLQAQSFALQNISGNIANSSTTGYKGTNTSFEDLVPMSTTPDQQAAGGVRAHAQATITTQGTISATGVGTNMAISGAGFFNVQKPVGIVDNVPVFTGVGHEIDRHALPAPDLHRDRSQTLGVRHVGRTFQRAADEQGTKVREVPRALPAEFLLHLVEFDHGGTVRRAGSRVTPTSAGRAR